MLLLRQKVISISGVAVKVYSVDNGKTWVSRPGDLTGFKRRVAHMKTNCRIQFLRIVPTL